MTRWWAPSARPHQSVTNSVVIGDVFQVADVAGSVTINADRLPFRIAVAGGGPVPISVTRARAQPSRLLLARHQIVPFSGRERTLDRVAEWVGGNEPIAALLIHGAGGQGKTRLAGQVGVECAAGGWSAWQATPAVAGTSTTVSKAELPGNAVLAVVDYADRWSPSALLDLLARLRDLHAAAGAQVRVLMLARSDGYWWPAVAQRAESELSVAADQLELPTLAADSTDDRAALFVTAADRFATALNVDRADWPVPDLSGDGFAQVLAVHMAALAAVDAARHGEAPPTRPDAVSAYLLRREQAYWHQLHARNEAPVASPPEVMHRAVVAATLVGVRDRVVAGQALAAAGFADSETLARQIIDDHTVCYPPDDADTVFEPLHPDRLGEDLIGLSTPGHGHHDTARLDRDWTPGAITCLLTGRHAPEWTSKALAVLVETAYRWPVVATKVLFPFVRQHPRLMITAGGAALTRFAGIPGIDRTILLTLEPLLPEERHIDLDIAAAAVSAALMPHRLATTTDPARVARLQADHAWRLANAGRYREALRPAQEAAQIYRRLAQADPDPVHQSGLGTALGYLGAFLSHLGERDDALGPAQEAVGVHRRLVETYPGGYLLELAGSLVNLGALLPNAGRWNEALDVAREAVSVLRRLAEDRPASLPDLATALANLGMHLDRLGRHEEAVGPVEEAVVIQRRLVSAKPATHLPDLALSLANLGNLLSQLGRYDEALRRAEEAVDLYRRLAAANPDVHLPGLARALRIVGARLSAVGRLGEALIAAEEAVTIERRLVAINPSAHLSALASALINLTAVLGSLDRHAAALRTAEEAVAIRRRLAAGNRTAYLPDLATAVANLGVVLAEVGRDQDAREMAEEAVALRRQLAEENPVAFLPDLANALTNAAVLRSLTGHLDDALSAADEAVSILRQLARTRLFAHLPDLATALGNLSEHWSRAGFYEDAVDTSDEATAIHRQLAAENPTVYAAQLARSLTGLSERLDATGLHEDAVTAAQEAADVYQQLAGESPVAYVPRHAESLINLGLLQARAGRRQDALSTSEAATDLYRRLAEADRTAHLLALARATAVVGVRLSDVDRHDDSVRLVGETVDLYRELAAGDPAHVTALARSLINLSIHLARVGRNDEALRTSEEAVAIDRKLAEASTAGPLSGLVVSLHELARRRSDVGDRAGAMAAVTEAIDICRRSANTVPEIFLRSLAALLENLADLRSQNGDSAGSRDAIAEAADTYRQLAQDDPDAVLADLADVLRKLPSDSWVVAISALPRIRRAWLRAHHADWLFEHDQSDRAETELERAAAEAAGPAVNDPPHAVAQARQIVRAVVTQWNPTDRNLPAWATTPVPDEHLAFVDAYLAAVSMTAREAKLVADRDTVEDPALGESLAVLSFLNPGNAELDEISSVIDAVRERGFDEVLAELRSQDRAQRVLDAWIAAPSWSESITYLRENLGALTRPAVREIIARSDDPIVCQHAAILSLAERWPPDDILQFLTTPDQAADRAIHALETADLINVADLMDACPMAVDIAGMRPLFMAVRYAAEGEDDQAIDMIRTGLTDVTISRKEAYRRHLRKLLIAGNGDLTPTFRGHVTKLLEALGPERPS